MSSKSIDILAKLLSKENLTVVRVPARTASFDVFSRILELPTFKNDIPEVLEEMFICHEIGHALYTPKSILLEVKRDKGFHQYWNVIEDIRIEKMVKVEYPGTRRTFIDGYKSLVAQRPDFFGTPSKADLFIDRINVFYKLGPMSGVMFSEKEWKYLLRIEKLLTPEDVLKFAEELYQLAGITAKYGGNSKELLEAMESLLEEEKETGMGDGEESETNPSDGNGDNPSEFTIDDPGYDVVAPGSPQDDDTSDIVSEVPHDPQRQKISLPNRITPDELKEQSDKIAPKTQVKFDSIIDSKVITDTKTNYLKLDNVFDSDPIISYKTILKSILSGSVDLSLGKKFIASVTPTVNLLVKEFEMRKSADMYKKTTTAKSGSLNMNKIHAYKLTDDIFKSISTVPIGKNHGMVFLLDWSGSIKPQLADTIKQMISLVLFCNKISIPFKVFAFTDSYSDSYSYSAKNKSAARFEAAKYDTVGTIFNGEGVFNLMEFLSSDMTINEFNKMCSFLLGSPTSGNRKYALGSTPLDAAVLYMRKYLPKFKTSNNLQKVSLCILTDGSSDALGNSYSGYYPSFSNGFKNNYFIRHNSKDYQIKENSHTDVFIEILKSEIDVSVISFFITDYTDVLSGVLANCNPIKYAENYKLIDISKIDSDGVYVNRDCTARDVAFIIPLKTLKAKDETLNGVDSNDSVEYIAREFTRANTSKIKSKIILKEFIKEIA